jgi:hypothetical protein
MSPPKTDFDGDGLRLPRVTIDLKVPLWAIASAAASVLWALVSMYFQLATMGSQMAEMQALLKASNASTIELARAQALVEYRLTKLEAAGHPGK